MSGYRSKRPRCLHDLDRFDQIAILDGVEAFEGDTALESFGDLPNVILESTQRGDGTFPHNLFHTSQADLVIAGDIAILHVTSGNRPSPRRTEDLSYFEGSHDAFLLCRGQQTRQSGTQLFDDFIDDAVFSNLDTLVLGNLSRRRIDRHVKGDDDRSRS